MAQYVETPADVRYGELWHQLRDRLDDAGRELLVELDETVGKRLWEAQDLGARVGPCSEPDNGVPPIVAPHQLEAILGIMDDTQRLLDETQAELAQLEADEEFMETMSRHHKLEEIRETAQGRLDSLRACALETAEVHGHRAAETMVDEIAEFLGTL